LKKHTGEFITDHEPSDIAQGVFNAYLCRSLKIYNEVLNITIKTVYSLKPSGKTRSCPSPQNLIL
jgi:hypothetical protein